MTSKNVLSQNQTNSQEQSDRFDLRGKDFRWGIWERMIPEEVGNDAASLEILEIHMKRYQTAANYVKDKQVLDIACGTGYGTQMLAQAGAKLVVGVDVSPETVAYAQERYQTTGVEFFCADAEQFDRAEKFDTAVSFETIEHLPHPDKFLDRLHNLLVPEGYLILSVPLGETRHFDPYHLHVFSQEDVFNLLENAGFSIKEHRCDPWFLKRADLMRWSQEYPENQPSISELFFTSRGRKFMTDFIFKGGFNMPQLLVIAQRK